MTILHPRPWFLHANASATVWIEDANGEPFLCVGPVGDRNVTDEAIRIVVGVQPREIELDAVVLPKAAWDDLVERALDPSTEHTVAQSIREAQTLMERGFPGLEWVRMGEPVAEGGAS